ncbi:zinc finger CCCH domain-containing protein 6-like [Thalictrum thalictroides]|uniref:Zinc finger CCCH domain-containing protein 6-like n=1 Tax=Thalictrum thalictroides TaxID=46969 RepID=A0A7J6V2E2_THATH|nr:zinc finger CCCH domain-containing protein 6-like [Thalictrum thalictroides]
MVRSQKSKRVSWPSDVNLCQIRLFLSEDSPSQVGLGAQDNLQIKASWLLHSAGAGFEDQLPPGFEAAQSGDKLKKELSQIPLVIWQCPPRFELNPHWRVVSGEESKDVEVQKQREMRVLEAYYPRPSAIPPCPSVSSELEDSHYEDHHIPRIPITPIEDEDATYSLSEPIVVANNPVSSQLQALPQNLGQGNFQKPQSDILAAPKSVGGSEKSGVGVVPGVEPDVVAAASAAFTAIMRSNEQGSLIDHELLIKILSNPKLIEKLVTDHGTGPNPQPVPIPSSLLMNLSVVQSGPPPAYVNRVEPSTPSSVSSTSGIFHPITNAMTPMLHPSPSPGAVPIAASVVKPPPVKDVNYYKSLIQQHGGEKQEAQEHTIPQYVNHPHLGSNTESLQNSKLREPKSKNKRQCIYFNSSRGCKNGAKCAFQHDMSVQQRNGSMPEAHNSKRMKIDREIAGRT